MKIYDISQELFSCRVYPGDPKPEKTTLASIERGDLYNLTQFSMCAHNGTHIDAPFHFIKEGKTVDKISLSSFVGMAFVAHHSGDVSGDDADLRTSIKFQARWNCLRDTSLSLQSATTFQALYQKEALTISST